jgi:hypothetical protein
MTSAQGRPDPVSHSGIGPPPLRGSHATQVLAALRDADFAETTAVPVVPRAWFRNGSAETPRSIAGHPRPVAPERRVERTGRLRLPQQHALDALSQEMGMKARDLVAGHEQESLAAAIVHGDAWHGIKRGYGELRTEFEALYAEERAEERAALAEERDLYRRHLEELDAFGLEHEFTGAVARNLGRKIARHQMSPWSALVVLKDHANPLHWAPPPRSARVSGETAGG